MVEVSGQLVDDDEVKTLILQHYARFNVTRGLHCRYIPVRFLRYLAFPLALRSLSKQEITVQTN